MSYVIQTSIFSESQYFDIGVFRIGQILCFIQNLKIRYFLTLQDLKNQPSLSPFGLCRVIWWFHPMCLPSPFSPTPVTYIPIFIPSQLHLSDNQAYRRLWYQRKCWWHYERTKNNTLYLFSLPIIKGDTTKANHLSLILWHLHSFSIWFPTSLSLGFS